MESEKGGKDRIIDAKKDMSDGPFNSAYLHRWNEFEGVRDLVYSGTVASSSITTQIALILSPVYYHKSGYASISTLTLSRLSSLPIRLFSVDKFCSVDVFLVRSRI